MKKFLLIASLMLVVVSAKANTTLGGPTLGPSPGGGGSGGGATNVVLTGDIAGNATNPVLFTAQATNKISNLAIAQITTPNIASASGITFGTNTYTLYGLNTNSYLITGCPSNYYNTAVWLDKGNTANSIFVYTNTDPITGMKVYLVFNDPYVTTARGFSTWSMQTNYPDTLTHYDFQLNSSTTNLMVNNIYNWQNNPGRVYVPSILVYAQDNQTAVTNLNGLYSGVFNGNGGININNGFFASLDTVSNVPGYPYPQITYPTNPFTVDIEGDSIANTNTCWHGPGWSLNYMYINQRGHPFLEPSNTSYYFNASVCGQGLAALTNNYITEGHTVSPLVTGNPGYMILHAIDNDYNNGSAYTNTWISEMSNFCNYAHADGWKIVYMPGWSNSWNTLTPNSYTYFTAPCNTWMSNNTQLWDLWVPSDVYFQTNQQLLMQGPHPLPGYFWQASPSGAAQLAILVNSVLTPQKTYWQPATLGTNISGRIGTNNLPVNSVIVPPGSLLTAIDSQYGSFSALTTNASGLVTLLYSYPTNNITTATLDCNVPNATLTASANITFASPININPTNEYWLTRSIITAGSLLTVTGPANCWMSGTLNVTNAGTFFIHIQPNIPYGTNAVVKQTY